LPDSASRPDWFGQPEIGIGERIDSVGRPVDGERSTEPSGTAAKIANGVNSAPPAHQLDPIQRFECPYEHARADAAGFAR
jgi:hypothetical protein